MTRLFKQMMAPKLKRWRWFGIGLLPVVALGAIAVFEYLNFTGFCYSESRHPSDQELIDAVIRYEINHISSYYLARGAKKYASVEEFHQLNPICCRLDKWGDPAFSIWDRRYGIWVRRILGQELLIVRLRYRTKDEGLYQFTGAHYLIDACGKVHEAGVGGDPVLSDGPTRTWEGTGHD